MFAVDIRCRKVRVEIFLWIMRWWAKMSGEKRRVHRPDVLKAEARGARRIVTLGMTRWIVDLDSSQKGRYCTVDEDGDHSLPSCRVARTALIRDR